MKLLLICKTAIVIKMFSLVCNKLNITLLTQNHNNVEENVDILVLDTEYIDDSFNSKREFCKKIGAINNEDLSFDKSRDFIIPRPFLPMQLQNILADVLLSIQEDKSAKSFEEKKDYSLRDEENYMGSLADFIAQDLDEENDESIVSSASLKNGGVLDKKELGAIKNLLDIEPMDNEVEMNDNDWQDLGEIIDKALEEVQEYEFSLNELDTIKLTLNKFTMEELKPLLLKLDQNSIDKLTNGKSLNLELKLKDEM